MDPRIIDWERRAKKARTATSILDIGAWIGLFASCIFWNSFFWGMIAPQSIPDMALSVAMAAGYAVVLPMLISLLAPSTPAGMALAETRWRTFGHVLSVAAALYMSYSAFTVLWAWWAARPAASQTGLDLNLAIGAVIVFVVVPALAWVQVAPDRWVADIHQAQQVKRMKAAQQANLMAAQVSYVRAISQLRRGVANLTAAECEEVAGIVIMMQRAENEAINDIADRMGLVTGIDTGVPLLDDQQLLDAYDHLSQRMTRLIAPIHDDDYVEPQPAPTDRAAPEPTAIARAYLASAGPPARPTVAHQDAETFDRDRQRSIPTVDRHGPSRTAQSTAVAVDTDRWLAVARQALGGGAWKRADLQRALSIEKTQATDLIRAWKNQGLLMDITEPAYHYAWTMTEEA